MTTTDESVHAPRRPRRRRRWPLTPLRTLVLAAVIILVVAAAVVVVRVTNTPTPPPDPGPCGSGLASLNGSCIGVSESSDFGDPALLGAVMTQIAQQNQEAERDAPAGVGYYSVAYLLPLEPPGRRTGLSTELVHELQGAANAQAEYNVGRGVQIKLLVANAGPDNAAEATVVPLLRAATTGRDRLRAVAGMGHSLDATRQAIRDLTDPGDGHEVAVIGSRLTADSLSTVQGQAGVQGFFRIAPTNLEQTAAAAKDMRDHGYERPLLVSDQDKTDQYVASLANDFTKAYPPATTGTFNHGNDGLAASLDSIRLNYCSGPAPGAVYFAGRGDVLAEFVRALSHRTCPTRPVHLYTASDIGGLRDLLQNRDQVLVDALTAGDKPGGVTVTYTGLANPAMWGDPRWATAFNSADKSFLGSGKHATIDLSDGNAIMAHDAVALAHEAITKQVGDPPREVSASAAIEALGSITGPCALLLGASGPISLDANGNAMNKPFPILALGPDGTATYRGSYGTVPPPCSSP